jgi:ABC-type polysaccharide/polyol phosphate export permease
VSQQSYVSIFDAKRKKIGFFSAIEIISGAIRYRYVLFNLVGTSLRARYRRSLLGFLWSLLNPLFTMVILSVVFSTIYKLPFTDFGVYIMSGLLPWNLVSNSLMGGATSFIGAEGYLKKVYLPKQIFPMAVLGVELVNFLLSLISLFAFAILLGAKPGLAWLALPPVLLLISIFLFGLILVISVGTVYFRDLSHILQIGLTGLFYLTPIVYPASFVLETKLRILILVNPFYYFIEIFHLIISNSVFPPLEMWLVCIFLSTISFGIGVFIFYKKENDIIYRL